MRPLLYYIESTLDLEQLEYYDQYCFVDYLEEIGVDLKIALHSIRRTGHAISDR